MKTIELRNKIINYVNNADEVVLQKLLSFLNFEESKETIELPDHVLKSLEKAEEDIREGRVYSHEEAMSRIKKKYNLGM